MSHPFPLPSGLESQWSAREHQQAANFYWYEAQGYNEAAFQRGECDANYKPLQSMMLSAHRRHASYARAKKVQS